MNTIPRNSLSAALKNQLVAARARLTAIENDPALLRNSDKWHDAIQTMGDEIKRIEYATKLAETQEWAFAKMLECLQTVRQLDTSRIPEKGEIINGQTVPAYGWRLNTPRESAEHVLYELRHMGLVDIKEIITEQAA